MPVPFASGLGRGARRPPSRSRGTPPRRRLSRSGRRGAGRRTSTAAAALHSLQGHTSTSTPCLRRRRARPAGEGAGRGGVSRKRRALDSNNGGHFSRRLMAHRRSAFPRPSALGCHRCCPCRRGRRRRFDLRRGVGWGGGGGTPRSQKRSGSQTRTGIRVGTRIETRSTTRRPPEKGRLAVAVGSGGGGWPGRSGRGGGLELLDGS